MVIQTTTHQTAPKYRGKIRSVLFSVGLAGLTLTLAMWSLAWALSDLRISGAKSFLQDVSRTGGGAATVERWKNAVEGVRFARHFNPRSADHPSALGRLHLWQSWQDSRLAHARAYQNAALLRFRQAVANRPTWGAGWVQLAEAAALLSGINAEVRHALHRAERFGAWERHVQRKTAWIGIASWRHLSEADRELIRRTVARALVIENDVEGLERLSARYAWKNEFSNVVEAVQGRSHD